MTNEQTIPPIAATAPDDAILTRYDQQHLATYLRLLDAEEANANWEEVARVILKLNPKTDQSNARHTWESHLARAHWLTNNGYRQLLRGTSGG